MMHNLLQQVNFLYINFSILKLYIYNKISLIPWLFYDKLLVQNFEMCKLGHSPLLRQEGFLLTGSQMLSNVD